MGLQLLHLAAAAGAVPMGVTKECDGCRSLECHRHRCTAAVAARRKESSSSALSEPAGINDILSETAFPMTRVHRARSEPAPPK